jgi:hypothetical protein
LEWRSEDAVEKLLITCNGPAAARANPSGLSAAQAMVRACIAFAPDRSANAAWRRCSISCPQPTLQRNVSIHS